MLHGRTRRNIKDRSGVGAREVERYRELAKKISFAGQGCDFAYHPSFSVGETLYQVHNTYEYLEADPRRTVYLAVLCETLGWFNGWAGRGGGGG